MSHPHQPPRDCPLCPRLAEFRHENAVKFPHYHNNPVPSFGSPDAALLIVGLAPGLHGANATGRPFTGDYAGKILYAALEKSGLARGNYNPESFLKPSPSGSPLRQGFGGLSAQQPPEASAQGGGLGEGTGNSDEYPLPHPNPLPEGEGDSFELINCRVTNAARCVPPENKPTPQEVRTCNTFLKNEIAAMPNLRVILSLGQISHHAVIRALALKVSQHKFAHGAEHKISPPLEGGVRGGVGENNLRPPTQPSPSRGEGLILLSSYHTSRYNINTGVLTQAMFETVVRRAKALMEPSQALAQAG